MTACGIIALRVPGGWIMGTWDFGRDEWKQHHFVPFNTEFVALRNE